MSINDKFACWRALITMLVLLGSTRHFLLQYQILMKEQGVCRSAWCCCSSHEGEEDCTFFFSNHTSVLWPHHLLPALGPSVAKSPLWRKREAAKSTQGDWLMIQQRLREWEMFPAYLGLLTSTLWTSEWKYNHHYEHWHLKALPSSLSGTGRAVMN